MKNKRLLILIGCLVVLLLYFSYGVFNTWIQKAFPSIVIKPQLRTRDKMQNLLIAVAPLATYKFSAGEGVKVQKKIAEHMEKDLGLRVLLLPKPVPLKEFPNPFDIRAGTENAEKILAETGADLLIWGNENVMGNRKEWTVYISASIKAQCLAREQGFSIHSTSDLDEVAEADLLEVLDWATASWRGLIDNSQGMYIAKTMEPMVEKIDTVLGLVAEKRMGPRALVTVKSNLAFFLSSYGIQTNNVRALTDAIRLAREGEAQAPIDPETKMPMGDVEMESILGKCLFTLGNMQNDPKNLVEAVKVYQRALRRVNCKFESADCAVLQYDLGAALAELGKRQGDTNKIHEAIRNFEAALEKTDKQFQPEQWLCVQSGLGSSYLFLGAREMDTANLKKAIPHYLSALSNGTETNQPNDYTGVEMNLGVLYTTLGEREKSAEDLRQATLYISKAVDRFTRMGNNYGLGFALCSLGQAQVRLSSYTDDDSLLEESLVTLKRSQNIVPRTQDMTMWSNCQLYLALGDEAKAAKTFDVPTLQDGLDKIVGLKNLCDPETRRPMWNELCEFQSEFEILLGNLDCDTKRADRIIQMMNANKAAPGFQLTGLPLVQTDECLGKAENQKGLRIKDSQILRQAIAHFEEALSIANKGNMTQIQCSLKSEMASAYGNLLLLTPDSNVADRAKVLVQILEKDCMISPIPLNQASHQLSAAKLERALASLDKDKTRLSQGRALALAGLKLLNEHHYVFFAAVAQEELGNEDYLLGKLTGDKAALKKALVEYTAAVRILGPKGFCLTKDIETNIQNAEALAKK